MEHIERMELTRLKFKMVGKDYPYDKCKLECKICPLNYSNNHREMSCHGFEKWYPEEALANIMDYLKANEKQYPDLRQ